MARHKVTFRKDYDDPHGNIATYEVMLDGVVVGSMEKSASWNGERYAADFYGGEAFATIDEGEDFRVDVPVTSRRDARQALTECRRALRAYVLANADALRAHDQEGL